MTTHVWSFVLQWSRVGIGAVLFLIAARYLSLAEIGLFATAYAPIRISQGLHKAGISESVVIMGDRPRWLDALFSLSLVSGLALSMLLAGIGAAFEQPMLILLALIPLLNGLSAVSEGLLRKELRLRTLALRTITAQSIAAGLALWMIFDGWGAWALTGFALANSAIGCALVLALAPWRPHRPAPWKYQSLLLPKVIQIAGRDMVQSSLLPAVQLAIGLTLGLSAAGVFQIATRVMGLIEALSLSPLRFIALPQLAQQDRRALKSALSAKLRATAILSAWVWGGMLAATSSLLSLGIGVEHAAVVTPVLQALAPFGLISALLMPLMQGLTAQRQTGLVMQRAFGLALIGGGLCAPMLALSATACAAALSLASALSALWILPRALQHLPLNWPDLSAIIPPLAAAALMIGALFLPGLHDRPLLGKICLGTAIYLTSLGLLTLGTRRSIAI